jgi:nucleoside-diphosphate-sugar epimerase
LIFNFEKASVTIKILEDIWDSIKIRNINRNRLKNNSYIDCRREIPNSKEEKQKKSKALVTGASGFVGKHLVEELLKNDYTVRVVIRKINERFEKNKLIEVIYGDIRNPEVVAKATEEVDIVYHCAALTTNKGPWHTFQENNIEATRNLLKAAKKFKIKKFVFVSTVAVYGFKNNKDNKDFCENDELGRGLPYYSYYAHSKIEAEKLIWEYFKKKNLPVVVLRPGIIFGPNGRKASQRRKIIFGAKRKILPYIFVKDVVKAMILAGNSEVAVGKTYNLVYDDQPTQGEFNDLKNRIIGIKKAGLYLPRPVMFIPAYLFEFFYRKKKSNASPPFNIYHYKSIVRNLRYDNKKIKTELGWSPAYSIEDGIKETFEYVKN